MKEFEVVLKCKYAPGKGIKCKVINDLENQDIDLKSRIEMEPIKECEVET
jgi:hypothetical protein